VDCGSLYDIRDTCSLLVNVTTHASSMTPQYIYVLCTKRCSPLCAIIIKHLQSIYVSIPKQAKRTRPSTLRNLPCGVRLINILSCQAPGFTLIHGSRRSDYILSDSTGQRLEDKTVFLEVEWRRHNPLRTGYPASANTYRPQQFIPDGCANAAVNRSEKPNLTDRPHTSRFRELT
jgi:hypothetical protein